MYETGVDNVTANQRLILLVTTQDGHGITRAFSTASTRQAQHLDLSPLVREYTIHCQTYRTNDRLL